MKDFDSNKFCECLLNLRGSETQTVFAEKLGINRSTLSLLESGKQIPSLEILNKVCNLGAFERDSFFVEKENAALIYLMGTLQETDKEKVSEMIERMKIREKYEALARKGINDIN